jgi:hypothetical protein
MTNVSEKYYQNLAEYYQNLAEFFLEWQMVQKNIIKISLNFS